MQMMMMMMMMTVCFVVYICFVFSFLLFSRHRRQPSKGSTTERQARKPFKGSTTERQRSAAHMVPPVVAAACGWRGAEAPPPAKLASSDLV